MSRSRLLLTLPIAGAASLILVFQNCAKTIDATEVPTEITALETMHIDREHGTVETMEKAVVETRSEDLISDRVLLMAQLTAIFGPSVPSLDTDGIRVNMTEFGSPCSLYENYLYETKNAKGEKVQAMGESTRGCALNNTASALKATSYPQASVVRQGTMGHMCLKLSTTPATLKFALGQIKTGSVPEPTDANILKAFRLFYRNTPAPPESLIESLQVMMPGMSPDRPTQEADWSPVLYTICVSSGWQLL